MKRLTLALVAALFLAPSAAAHAPPLPGYQMTTNVSPPPCYGDGQSGARVQLVYEVSTNYPDRYATIGPQIANREAGIVDKAINASAIKTGSGRRLRLACTNGVPTVLHIVCDSICNDSSSKPIEQLHAQGHERTDRRYLVFWDQATPTGVSMGSRFVDDSDSSSNRNNLGWSGWALVGHAAWSKRFPASNSVHEFMHSIGAVQNSAPHTSGGGHCLDEQDAMCYPDSADDVLTFPCSDGPMTWKNYLQGNQLDCGEDDYFHPNPPAGSYLDTHWNSADSSYLEPVTNVPYNTTQAENFPNQLGTTIIYGDPGAAGGAHAQCDANCSLIWGGSIYNYSVLRVRAKGTAACGSYPHMLVQINGSYWMDREVTANWKEYLVNVWLDDTKTDTQASTVYVGLQQFDWDASCPRQLSLDRVSWFSP